jgi:hypothetical protein
LLTKVLDVRGDVEREEWKVCKLGDEYPEKTRIRTGLRSSIKLQIGAEEPYTAMVIDSAANCVLSESYRTQDTKRTRIGVGYGKVRAGVAEGGLKSDFTVDSPVATLSKRGTWDFGLYYERGTDRFEVSLLGPGLVEALNKATMQRREVLSGEAVTETMRRWLDEAEIRDNVPIADLFGQGDAQAAFSRLSNEGLRVLGPESGSQVATDLSSSHTTGAAFQLAARSPPALLAPPGGAAPGAALLRPEGFFGTGRGEDLIQVIVKSNSQLARRFAIKPGTPLVLRSAGGSAQRQQGTSRRR